MSIRKLGLAGGDEARGGVRVAFVPVSVNVTHPLDLCSEMSVPPPARPALCDRFVSKEAE